MKFDLETISEGVIVVVQSENLDASNVKTFEAGLLAQIESHRDVLLDMSRLAFIDSSGLGALLSCLRTANGKQGQLKLFAMTKQIHDLFELVRMQRIFSIYNTREEALAALAP